MLKTHGATWVLSDGKRHYFSCSRHIAQVMRITRQSRYSAASLWQSGERHECHIVREIPDLETRVRSELTEAARAIPVADIDILARVRDGLKRM